MSYSISSICSGVDSLACPQRSHKIIVFTHLNHTKAAGGFPNARTGHAGAATAHLESDQEVWVGSRSTEAQVLLAFEGSCAQASGPAQMASSSTLVPLVSVTVCCSALALWINRNAGAL
jgi:hypothetical protein